jgi:hypothetical protein
MILLLTKQASHPDLTQEFKFVTFAVGKIATSTFLKAVLHSQCAFEEANHRAIAIEGLWPELCKKPLFVSKNLKVKFPAVKAVVATPRSTAVNANRQINGRYNILCSKQDFVSLAYDIRNRLEIIYDMILSLMENPLPLTLW